MSILDSVLWNIEDYTGRAADVAKEAAMLAVMVTRAFPWAVGILLISLSAFGFWLDSGNTHTLQQQIMAHNRPNGETVWLMQQSGENPSGFLGIATSFGDKKQEADFTRAARFCTAHKGFMGCQQVIKAANATFYGI